MKLPPGLEERLHTLISASLAAQNTTTSTSAFVLRVLEEPGVHVYLTKDAHVMRTESSTTTPVRWSDLTDVVETSEIQRVLRAASERFDDLRGLADLDVMRAPSSFEAALDQPGEVLAAWERDDVDDRLLYAVSVGAAGWKRLYTTTVEPRDRALVVERIGARQRRIGSLDRNCDYAWVSDDRGLSIWSLDRQVLHAHGPALRLDDTMFSCADFVRIDSFRDRVWSGDNGVMLVHRDGTQHLVAEYNPGYHRDPFVVDWQELELATHWCVFLANDMARYLGIPHQCGV